MQLAQFENGIEKHTQNIADMISENQFYIQSEGGYHYTVGLNKLSLPEIIMKRNQGLSHSGFEELIFVLRECRSMREFLKALKAFDLNSYPLQELEKRRLFYSARLFYGDWDFHAVCLKSGGNSG